MDALRQVRRTVLAIVVAAALAGVHSFGLAARGFVFLGIMVALAGCGAVVLREVAHFRR